ncbi:MAG: hypothetical protein ACYTGW_09080 [Planctomycetota bacterium]
MKLVEGFLRELGTERHSIKPGSGTLSAAEKHLFRWVAGAIPEPMAHHGMVEIRVSRATVGSPGAYEIMRHLGQGFAKLSPARSYIQLHVVHSRSDPELHGIIDLDPIRLLSFWKDGA